MSTSPSDNRVKAAGPVSPADRCILVATDGSDNAARAAEYGAELATTFDTLVVVVAVAVERDAPMFPWNPPPTEHPVPSDVAVQWSHPHADRIRSHGVDVVEVILEGHPADAIISVANAHSADMIVIGRSGVSAPPASHPGSVAEELARRSPCALVIVP